MEQSTEHSMQCWIISVPGNPSADASFKKLKGIIDKFKGSTITKFYIPNLACWTFDQLISATEDAPRVEKECESTLSKLGHSLSTVLNKLKLDQTDLTVGKLTLTAYLLKFSWDQGKYLISQSLTSIISQIDKQIKQIEAVREAKLKKFVNIQDVLNNCEKKRQGPLNTRAFLGDLVSIEDFINDSKYLMTVLVIVPKHSKDSWYNCYEDLHDEVIPRSTKLLYEEEDQALFTVGILKRCKQEFKENARKKNFVVREYEFKDNEMYSYNQELTNLQADKSRLQLSIISWLKENFSNTFVAYCHLKAIEIHSESALRFSQTHSYQAAVVMLEELYIKKVRKALYAAYSDVDELESVSSKKVASGTEIMMVEQQQDHYPYVYTKIKATINEIVKK